MSALLNSTQHRNSVSARETASTEPLDIRTSSIWKASSGPMSTQSQQDDRLILGIDGGGTKTIASLARVQSPADILGQGYAGPSNQRAVGPRIAMGNLDSAVQAAFESAKLERSTVEAACLGLAGADRPSDRTVVEDWAQEARLAQRLRVVNDAIPLLYAGSGNGFGIALIAGTGSLAWGRNSQYQVARSGGWGYLFGDEGSAYALGRAILQAVTWSSDGRGPATCLLQDVQKTLQISSPAEIVTAVYSHEVPRAVIASLAPLVFDAADRQDVVSCDILNSAATELAAMVVAVTRRLNLQTDVSLFLTGALMLQQPKFRDMVLDGVASRGLQLGETTVVAEAVRGSVRMAHLLALQMPENQ
jgi:N-acetylglucosamine kinase-like BadF-type ATPase